MRKVRTASGAVAVQVVTKDRGRLVEVDHVGSGHTDAELALLLEVAGERLRPGQDALDLGPLSQAEVRVSDVADFTAPRRLNLGGAGGWEDGAGRPRMVAGGGRVVSTGSLLLWQVLADAYAGLGFDAVGDETFKKLVLARIIEPTSKADTIRVLGEVGVLAPALRTIFRALGRCIARDYRDTLARACLAHSARTTGRAAMVLYDCTTLYFEGAPRGARFLSLAQRGPT